MAFFNSCIIVDKSHKFCEPVFLFIKDHNIMVASGWLSR